MIGKRLRLARQFCRSGAMTADELVTKILLERQFDIDKNAISKIETQKRGVQDYEVKLFAEMLDVSADWLLGLTDNGGPERLSEGATR